MGGEKQNTICIHLGENAAENNNFVLFPSDPQKFDHLKQETSGHKTCLLA